MKTLNGITTLLIGCIALVPVCAKEKKHTDLSAAFKNARYVYVQAEEGDVMNPRLFPEDRQAITDVQNSLDDWGRYAITTDSTQADLIFVVRKGRLVGVQAHGGINRSDGPIVSSGQGRQSPQGQSSNNDELEARADIGPAEDLVRVYIPRADGGRTGPIWTGESSDGLDSPVVPLIRRLRDDVERAYPSQPTKP